MTRIQIYIGVTPIAATPKKRIKKKKKLQQSSLFLDTTKLRFASVGENLQLCTYVNIIRSAAMIFSNSYKIQMFSSFDNNIFPNDLVLLFNRIILLNICFKSFALGFRLWLYASRYVCDSWRVAWGGAQRGPGGSRCQRT